MKQHYGIAAIAIMLLGTAYLTSSAIKSTVSDVAAVASGTNSPTPSGFVLSPSTLSSDVTQTNARFDNAVNVSMPNFTGYSWPAWYVTNTAPWNTITYHYGKGQPNGYGPGTLQWTTDLTGYAPGTYTDTITLSSDNYGSVSLQQTVHVLGSAPSSNPAPATIVPITQTALNGASSGASVGNQNTNPPANTPAPSTTGTTVFKLSPSSSAIQIPADGAAFANAVDVSLPGFTSYPWPAWYVTNTAAWDTLTHHYGKGQPDGFGPGTIQWTTNLAGYKPGTYTDTITLSSTGAKSVSFSNSVTVLPNGVPPASADKDTHDVTLDTQPAQQDTPPIIDTQPVAPPTPPTTPAVPSAPNPNLPPHPRVWMTPDRITALKAQMAANTSRWQAVKADADSEVAEGTAITDSSVDALPDICEVYLATGQSKYAARASAILTNFAVPSNTLQSDSAYPYRFFLPLATTGLDWCYNGLTTAVRQQTATWLMDRADWVWPQSNPSRTGAWGMWPSSNYYWGFMMSGPAALAADGDDTGVGTISGKNRPAFHQALALTLWNNPAVPVLESEESGGAWTEGTNYDSSWYVGRFADAFLTSGTALSTSFLDQSLMWRIESTMPGYIYKAPIGDQPRQSNAGLYTYDRMAALDMISAAQPSTSLASDIQLWLNKMGQVPTSEFNETGVLADELLHYNPNQPAAPDMSAMPKSYLAPGLGAFVYRNSWTDPNTTAFVFQSGLSTDHSTGNANGLKIWKGSFWISADANIWSASGIEQSTNEYNNLTTSAGGQTLYNQNTGQIVGTPYVSNSLVVIRGQAKDTYGYPPGTGTGRPLSDYLRTVAYLPQQDTFVVVDRATSASATSKTVHWQSSLDTKANGKTFVLSGPAGDYRCFGTVVAPTDVTLQPNTFALGYAKGQTTSYEAQVNTPSRTSDVIVTVLQCTNSQTPPTPPTGSVTASNATVSIGTNQVMVPISETSPVTLTVGGQQIAMETTSTLGKQNTSFLASVASAFKSVVKSVTGVFH